MVDVVAANAKLRRAQPALVALAAGVSEVGRGGGARGRGRQREGRDRLPAFVAGLDPDGARGRLEEAVVVRRGAPQRDEVGVEAVRRLMGGRARRRRGC